MNTALIVAAGLGTRTRLNQSKVVLSINNKPLFLYSVEVFLELGFKVILVVSARDLKAIESITSENVKIVIGGKTRSDSVRAGLKEVETPYVFIHDGARPLISKDAIQLLEEQLTYEDATYLAEPVTAALKEKETSARVKRDDYLLAQTPQAFLTEKIRKAYNETETVFEDDIAVYQVFYPNDRIVPVINEDLNIKVTYPNDLKIVKSLLERTEKMRIGHSFDIHQLTENRKLILGGIMIPATKGALGHSDADVLLHTITEALLGAVALGDLGTHFPDTNEEFKDIASSKMLLEAYEKVKEQGYIIQNIDSTVYLEEPKLSPYLKAIRVNIAKLLNVSENQVSVKATTYEKLDSIGRKEAIAAETTLLVRSQKI